MSDNLLISQSWALQDPNKPDVVKWHEIFKLISLGVSLVDRLEIIKFPYRFHNYFPIPTNLQGFNKSYTEICVDRANELLKLGSDLNKPIIVFWSGGIDSTAVLVSFILAGKTKNVIVSLNQLSIMENSKFYFKFIRDKFKIISSENMCELLTGDYILVGGEHNDQLFGSDVLGKLYKKNGFNFIFENYNQENVCKILQSRGISEDGSKLWYSILNSHIKNSPCEIKTIYDFFWWFNFAFKWQSVYFRMIIRVSPFIRDTISEDLLKKYYHQFFVTEDFQKWSMLNPDKKINKTWQSYKLAAKEFIFNFDKDQYYFDNKTKFGSLSKVFQHRQVPDALTQNYRYIVNLNKDEFYNENNSFC